MEGMMERTRGWGGVFGGCCLLVRGGKLNDKKTEIKYNVALDGCRAILTNKNQPKTRGCNGGGKGEEVWPGGVRGKLSRDLNKRYS
jgi:hypothetical protein